MRPIESLLLLANLAAFLALAIPLHNSVLWVRYLAPITLLLVIVQILAEGPRWQMIAAYVLAALIFLAWLLQRAVPSTVHAGRLAIGLSIGLGTLGLMISTALPILLPVFRFPMPTGTYAIGTTTYHWIDTSRPELFTTDPSDHRELMAQVWYPAMQESSPPRAPYMEDVDTLGHALARIFHFPRFFFGHFKYVTTHAVSSAAVADDKPSYPVLIFLTGAEGYRQLNIFQIEELVSHGYIVVGLDQPGAVASVRFPDGREVPGLSKEQIIPLIQQSVEPLQRTPTLYGNAMPDGIIRYFAQDVSFTLDQLDALNKADPNSHLTGRLDLGRVGTFGISLGGMNAAEACVKDPRLKACLIMDVYMPADVVNAGLRLPAMWITRDADTMRLERERAGGWTEKDIEQHQRTMREVYEGLQGDGYFLLVPGMFHIDFTDLAFGSPIFPLIGFSGPIGVKRAHDIVNAYSVAFFDRYLKGQPSPLLNGPSKQFPDVVFEMRRP